MRFRKIALREPGCLTFPRSPVRLALVSVLLLAAFVRRPF
jgi:hypothetical protein